jgi:hypothetical protein
LGIASDVRQWWRWRMRRLGVHMPPFGEYRLCGTILAEEDDWWRIEDDEGRVKFAKRQASRESDVKVGDRVEIEPIFQSTATSRLTNRLWAIVRKLD